ncbi:MAG: response regulator [Blautia sp.]|nr:response regulator [Blautia sp.]
MKKPTFGSHIRYLRKQHNMTQAQLAEQLGVTDKAVSKWERDLSYPDLALFPALANILGVTVDDLLNESTGEDRPSRLLRILGMSHDIRTPLHIILGCINLAELTQEDPELLLHYLESIRISGEYLLGCINHLMYVAGQTPKAEDDKTYPANIQELSEYLNRRADARKSALKDYDFSGKRLLVVDDIAINREIIAESLKRTGAEVGFAESGDVCLDIIERRPVGYYDLILMDIMMPGMDGLETTRKIRKLPDAAKAAIPIIAVSANIYENDRNAAFEAGMNAFIEKPVAIDRLFEAMERIFS